MKKIYFILISILFFIGINICYADVTTYNRNELDNYGVNKKWDINDSNLNNVLKTPKVDAEEKVYDFSDLLTDEEEKQIKNMINLFIEKTNMDMVFVIYNLPYDEDSANEEFAADFYDYNDFGIDLDNYSGVLLFRNSYEADRYYNVYMFGDAQLYYSFNRCESVLDAIYYDFSNDLYVTGIDTFLTRMYNYYDSGIAPEYSDYYIDDMGYLKKKYIPPIILMIAIPSIVTLIIVGSLVKKNKMIYKEQKARAYLDESSVYFKAREDRFINSHTSSYTTSSSSGGGGGFSGGSSSGSSGEGHSSGGGRHG